MQGHVGVLQRLLGGLKAGGVLAVQMPDNLNEPSHVSMFRAAHSTPYTGKLKAAEGAKDKLLTPAGYHAALKLLGSRFEIWHSVYNHALDGVEGIVEWVKGPGLRPYLEALNKEEQGDYLKRYEALLVKHYPVQDDGKVLLRFPRIFMVAAK